MTREKRPTQADMTLRMLRKGPVHTNDLRREFIANPSERIHELETRGHAIKRERWPRGRNSNGVLYTLVRDTEIPADVMATGPDGQTFLVAEDRAA